VFQAVRVMESLSTVVDSAKMRFESVNVVFTGDLNAPPHYPATIVGALEALVHKVASNNEWEQEQIEDQDPSCEAWAAAGECHRDPMRVLAKCYMACLGAGITHAERRRLLCDAWSRADQCNDVVRLRCADACGERMNMPTEAAAPWAIVRSPVYELFTEGALSDDSVYLQALAVKASGLDPSQTLIGQMLRSRWSALTSVHAAALQLEPPTCMSEVLDYIFFSKRGRLTLSGVLGPPDILSYEESIRGVGSDHVPLIADFILATSITA